MSNGDAEKSPAQGVSLNAKRDALIETLKKQGIKNPGVLAAIRQVPRHEFVPEAQRSMAYENRPLPIGHKQTISQPYIVAYMTELLELTPKSRVLEIGTGCGYQTTILSELAGEVFTIEIIRSLGWEAKTRLERLGYQNIHTKIGDGSQGWPEEAPFDGIIVTAAPEAIPAALIDQLAPDGRLVVPAGPLDGEQFLYVIEKTATGKTQTQNVLPVKFVPMIGAE